MKLTPQVQPSGWFYSLCLHGCCWSSHQRSWREGWLRWWKISKKCDNYIFVLGSISTFTCLLVFEIMSAIVSTWKLDQLFFKWFYTVLIWTVLTWTAIVLLLLKLFTSYDLSCSVKNTDILNWDKDIKFSDCCSSLAKILWSSALEFQKSVFIQIELKTLKINLKQFFYIFIYLLGFQWCLILRNLLG